MVVCGNYLMKRDITALSGVNKHEFAHVTRGSNFIEIFIFRFVFWEIFNFGTIVFHSFTRNSNYSRPKECCFFDSVNCVFLLHMPVCLLPIC